MSDVFPTIDLGKYANMPLYPISSYDRSSLANILRSAARPVVSAVRSAAKSAARSVVEPTVRAFKSPTQTPNAPRDTRPSGDAFVNPPARPGGMGVTPEGAVYGTLPGNLSWTDLIPRAWQWQYEPHARPLEAVEAQKRLMAMTSGLPALTGQTFPAAMQHAMDRMWEINQANQRASLLARLLSGL